MGIATATVAATATPADTATVAATIAIALAIAINLCRSACGELSPIGSLCRIGGGMPSLAAEALRIRAQAQPERGIRGGSIGIRGGIRAAAGVKRAVQGPSSVEVEDEETTRAHVPQELPRLVSVRVGVRVGVGVKVRVGVGVRLG